MVEHRSPAAPAGADTTGDGAAVTAPPKDSEAQLIESVCELVRERMPDEQAAQAEEFARQFYRRAPAEDVLARDPLDLYGAAIAQLNFARRRTPGTAKVRAYNPTF